MKTSALLADFQDLILSLQADGPVLRGDMVDAAKAKLDRGVRPSALALADSLVGGLVRGPVHCQAAMTAGRA